MDRASSFATVVPVLQDRGHTVVAYDRAGYASAIEVEPFTDLRAAAADLVMRMDGRPGVAVGHSFGGHLALAAALEHPLLVRAVGVFETPWLWEPFWPADTSGGKAMAAAERGGPAAAGETFMRALVGDDVWGKLPPSSKQRCRAEGRALLADLGSVAAAPYDPRNLAVPLVASRGSEALPHQRAGTEWILGVVPGSEPFTIEGAGHTAHRSHPREFATFVLRVVARAGYALT
jgi:pimeloyl-ACP methyl ester carboxylesterase